MFLLSFSRGLVKRSNDRLLALLTLVRLLETVSGTIGPAAVAPLVLEYRARVCEVRSIRCKVAHRLRVCRWLSFIARWGV